jgi:hypothetical protein
LLAAASSSFDTRQAALATLRLAVVDLLARHRSITHDGSMIVVYVFGVLVLGGIALGLINRTQSLYRTDRLRELDPRLKEHVDGQFMRGDGGHDKQDWEYGGDKAEWD